MRAPVPLAFALCIALCASAGAHRRPRVAVRARAPFPCGYNSRCFNALALGYMNHIRRQGRRRALAPCTRAMLAAAVRHSKAQAKRHALYHQTSGFAVCGAQMLLENVAKNHLLRGHNVVRMCMLQFLRSPPHKRNLLDPRLDSQAMGVFVDRRGYIWCTQTLWVGKVDYGRSGECKKM